VSVYVVTSCQRCRQPMPDERADCWCAPCVTNRELDMLYGDDCDNDGGDDESMDCTCDQCGGDGVVELEDTPELWGEDCFSEENRLVTCPSCSGKGSN